MNECRHKDECINYGSFDYCIRENTVPLICCHYIKEHPENPISTVITADLVAELNRRGGCPVKCPTVDETSTAPVCLPVIPTAPLVAELCKREGVDIMTIPPENTAYTRVWHNVTRNDTSYGIVMDNTRFINGPAKIIVVRGDE